MSVDIAMPRAAEHLRYVQREMADRHRPVWWLRDRALAGDNSMLAEPDDDGTLAALKEAAVPWRPRSQAELRTQSGVELAPDRQDPPI